MGSLTFRTRRVAAALGLLALTSCQAEAPPRPRLLSSFVVAPADPRPDLVPVLPTGTGTRVPVPEGSPSPEPPPAQTIGGGDVSGTTPGGSPALPSPSPSAAAGFGGGGVGGGSGGAASAPSAQPARVPDPAPAQPPDCAPCADGARTGRVLAAEAPFGPIAGATVVAGGTSVTSAADGTFALPPPTASAATVVASATGRMTSAVAGWRDGDLDLHLAADGGAATGTGTTSFTVTGRVVDANGDPVAGARLLLGGSGRETAPVAFSAANGTFALAVTNAPAAGTTGATIWAFTAGASGQVSALGALPNLALVAGQALGDVAIAGPKGTVTVPAGLNWPFAGSTGWSVEAVAPGEVALATATLGGFTRSAPVFEAAGVTTRVRAWGRTADGRGETSWRRSIVAGDVLAPVFLAPPIPTAVLGLDAGAAWSWRPIPEVDGYRFSVRSATGGAWEAFTDLPRLTLPALLPAGPGRVRIVAASEGGLRSVSSVRQLRIYAPPALSSAWEGDVP